MIVGLDALDRCVAVLRDGGLVAFPTETVYGLGARADDSAAVRRIYQLKGRPATNPTIVHTANAAAAFALAAEVPERARALAEAFWPGPLTLVLPLRPGAVAPECTAHGATIALRVPSHPVAHELCARLGLPLAAPSANRSTRVSPTRPEHVEASFGEPSLLVLDGGATGFGIESTIVDLTRSPAVVLRPGSVELDALAEVTPTVDPGRVLSSEGERAIAPGTSLRHYAPNVPTRVLPSAAVAAEAARSTGFVVHSAELAARLPLADAVEVLPNDPRGYAALLYAALHALEARGVERIVIEAVPAEWRAVRDRLERAASTEILQPG